MRFCSIKIKRSTGKSSGGKTYHPSEVVLKPGSTLSRRMNRNWASSLVRKNSAYHFDVGGFWATVIVCSTHKFSITSISAKNINFAALTLSTLSLQSDICVGALQSRTYLSGANADQDSRNFVRFLVSPFRGQILN